MIGQTLTQLAFRELYGCNILQVSTPEEVIDMPGGHHILQKDSTLLMIGTDSQFKLFDTAINTQRLCMTLVEEPITMRDLCCVKTTIKKTFRYSYRALSLSTSTRLSLVNR